MFSPEFIEEVLESRWSRDPEGIIKGFAYDTRILKKGEVFLALRTEHSDGHNYLAQAKEAGSPGAIVERIDNDVDLPQIKVTSVLEGFQKIARKHRDKFRGTVIGITGSCGKTTTKDFLSLLLKEKGVHKTSANLNNLLGVPISLAGLDSRRHKYGVIEAGMNVKGEMERLGWMIAPDLAIITSIDPVHIAGVGSIEAIAQEKALLLKELKPDGSVFLHYSCLKYPVFHEYLDHSCIVAPIGKIEDIKAQYPKAMVIAYFAEPFSTDEIMLSLELNGTSFEWIVPQMSNGMLSNTALAISAALSVGIEVVDIQIGLSQWSPSEYRGQIERAERCSYYVDCYNANPKSMSDAFDFFERYFEQDKNRLYLLGCMSELGELSESAHIETGRKLKLRPNDLVMIIGPHSEFFAQGILEAGGASEQILLVNDRNKMQEVLNDFEGNVLMKGSKPYKLWELNRQNLAEAMSTL